MTSHLLLPGSDGATGAWDRVVAILAQGGQTAWTIALSAPGMVGRMTPGLARQVEVVEARLATEPAAEGRGTVLVGYSYSGLVASAVARRRPAAVDRIVFVDAILPELTTDLDQLPRLVPPVVRALLGDGAAALLTGPLPRGMCVTYVACTGRRRTPALQAIERSAAYARARALEGRGTWSYRELATGHRPMTEDPEALARLLTVDAGR